MNAILMQSQSPCEARQPELKRRNSKITQPLRYSSQETSLSEPAHHPYSASVLLSFFFPCGPDELLPELLITIGSALLHSCLKRIYARLLICETPVCWLEVSWSLSWRTVDSVKLPHLSPVRNLYRSPSVLPLADAVLVWPDLSGNTSFIGVRPDGGQPGLWHPNVWLKWDGYAQRPSPACIQLPLSPPSL